MNMVKNERPIRTTANDAADAVGLPFSVEKHWYVAIVKHGNEKICSKTLTELGYENYIPVQRVFKQYASGRKKWVDRLVLTSKVFVRTTENERLKNVVTLPLVYRFMVDPSRHDKNEGRSPAAVIPDKEMQVVLPWLKEHAGDMPIYILDLRQETHGYINGNHVSWYGYINWSNLGRSAEYVMHEEDSLFHSLRGKTVVAGKISSSNNYVMWTAHGQRRRWWSITDCATSDSLLSTTYSHATMSSTTSSRYTVRCPAQHGYTCTVRQAEGAPRSGCRSMTCSTIPTCP